MVFQGSRLVFLVPECFFLWFFKVLGWFLRFQMGFEDKSWLQVVFYSYKSVFCGSRWFFMLFMAPGLVFIIPGGFLLSLGQSRPTAGKA